MRNDQKVPMLSKVIIFIICFIIIYPVLIFWVGPLSYEHSHFWESLSSFFGDQDLEGFIMICLAIANFIIAAVMYNIILRIIERRKLTKK